VGSGGTFSQYEFLRKIARGGMGEVFLARQTGIEGFAKEVVLKRIHSEYADEPEFVKMFLQEARIAAMLDHPNIVQIYELGKHEKHYFIVMEYVPGLSLSRLIKVAGGPLPLQFSLQIILGLADGLQFAHDKTGPNGELLNLVHRDISPPNVLVSTAGSVKITDFGIAKIKESVTQTRAGVIKGKYAYISPEQARGGEADRRSDIYALGLVLYEVTTGERAYQGDDVEILRAVAASDYLPPEVVRPDYPQELRSILARCLALRPEERYQECQDLTDDLLAVQMDGRLATSPGKLGQYIKEMLTRLDALKAARRATQEQDPATVKEPISSNAFSPVDADINELKTFLLDRITSKTGTTGPITVDFTATTSPGTDQITYLDSSPREPPRQRPGSLTAAAGELLAEPRSRHLLPWIVLVTGLVVAGVVVAWVVATRGTAPPPQEVVVINAGGSASEASISTTDAGKVKVKEAEQRAATKAEKPAEKPAQKPAEKPAQKQAKVSTTRRTRPRSARRPRRATRSRRTASARPATPTPADANKVSLTLSTDPRADAFVGRRRLGRTPLTTRVPPGRVAVTLKNTKLGLRTRRTINTGSGGSLALRLVVHKDATLGFRIPAGRHIQLDGKYLGRTPRPPVKVYEGVHTVVVVDAAGKKKKLKVQVKAGRTAWVTLN
jgi:serine/threonine protein kinase